MIRTQQPVHWSLTYCRDWDIVWRHKMTRDIGQLSPMSRQCFVLTALKKWLCTSMLERSIQQFKQSLYFSNPPLLISPKTNAQPPTSLTQRKQCTGFQCNLAQLSPKPPPWSNMWPSLLWTAIPVLFLRGTGACAIPLGLKWCNIFRSFLVPPKAAWPPVTQP